MMLFDACRVLNKLCNRDSDLHTYQGRIKDGSRTDFRLTVGDTAGAH